MGLTQKQQKLPEALKKAILSKQKKDKKVSAPKPAVRRPKVYKY